MAHSCNILQAYLQMLLFSHFMRNYLIGIQKSLACKLLKIIPANYNQTYDS